MIIKSEQETNSIKSIQQGIAGLEEAFEVDAYQLRSAFYESRINLQAQAQSDLDNDARQNSVSAKRVWCSLHLSVRTLDGSLQIYWHTINIHRATKKKIYASIPKGDKESYDLRSLKRYAAEFEWELVKQTEADAATLRAKWKQMVNIRSSLKSIVKK